LRARLRGALRWASRRGTTSDALPAPLGPVRYSQGNEELLIRRFFADRRGGVFVDIGSGHWRDDSNTYALERHLDWHGIAVDALSHWEAGYRRNRSRTTFFNYIVTDHSGTVDPFYIAGSLSSTKRHHLEIFRNIDVDAVSIAHVPTTTLTDLLDAQRVTRIDLLSMDIEQAEPEALSGFDIRRFRPLLVCVEVGVDDVRDAVEPYFEVAGYEWLEEYRAHDILNWWFRPRPVDGNGTFVDAHL
jgi:FkbM family methyltransferase